MVLIAMGASRLLFVVLSISVCAAAEIERVVVSSRETIPKGFSIQQIADPKARISFTVLLKQRNLDRLEQLFHEVSNPKSEKYGQFLTKTELDNLVRADQAAFDEVMNWLAPFKGKFEPVIRADSVKIHTTVAVASQLLQTEFSVVMHVKTGKTFLRHFGDASVPAGLAPYVHFVAGISELAMPKHFRHQLVHRNVTASPEPTYDITITPTVLRNYYNVPANLFGTNRTNLQGIAAFNDFYSAGALAAFEADQNLAAANITVIGTDCLPENCDQAESDLDVQYMTAMARNVSTVFLSEGPNYWILEFTEDVLAMSPMPLVFSISYGWSDELQCEIAVTNCAKYGYNSVEYVNRTNTDFQKLGVLGVTVLVASGDDGAPSLGGASGNCPIDNDVFCPIGGCTESTSECQSFTIVNETTGSMCFFPMGMDGDNCSDWMNDPNINDMLNVFMEANSICDLEIEQDSDGNPQVYSTCGCANTRPVSTHGYKFIPYVWSQSNGDIFSPDYPASSPYVTSVGATQFTSFDGSKVSSEIPASVQSGAIFTTGGGFSRFQPQPSYQATVVQAYLKAVKQLPPSWSFDATMRGYPDIVFNGHNYRVFLSSNGNEVCPCLPIPVDGTSASSPSLAGLISLINDQLLNNGKTSVGFLNYMLYQMRNEAPQAFHDITEGSNRCNSGWCCKYGFEGAKSAWDPVTGLGSPNFGPFMNYILQQKAVAV
eukprot:TRINITY_DN2795_c0_g2_i1.p1 TRINITY_DN2795_c0_g2~~TRINITY_DN2795_c0_g2_i1.p1  ORF type:complete len:745 (+),score=248.03 TRINITY_DN2795_c0_g2_i1:94-2235(+)